MDKIREVMGTIGEKLVPNLLSFVIQFLSFIILLVIVFLFAYKPVKKVLKKRSDHIEKQINEASENVDLAESKIKEANDLLVDSKIQASNIIKNAENAAIEKAENIVDQAKQQSKVLMLNAQEEIKNAKQEALDEIKQEMVNIALTASKEILKREIDEKENNRLAEDIVNQLN